LQHKHSSTLIIKSSQKPKQNQQVNPPGSAMSRLTHTTGRLWPIFFTKLSGYHVVS
jgi:hypothetical protein